MAILLTFAADGRAAFYTVTSTTDGTDATTHGGSGASGSPFQMSSLRGAILNANAAAGSSTISLPSGTYNLSLGDLLAGTAANTTIYIHGTGTPANTTIHQAQSGRMVFNVNPNVNANVVFALDNVTVSGGSENELDPDGFGGNGGAMLAGGSSSAPGNVVNLTNVVFDQNYCSPVSNAGADGGAIAMSGGGNLNVYNCVFTGNNASKNRGVGYGGAIEFDNGANPGNVFISGCVFSNNLAPGAAGGALSLAGGTAGIFVVNNNTFVNNSCVSGVTYGGAIYCVSGNLTANYNRFKGNVANSGGSIYVGNNAGTMGDARNNWWGVNNGPNTAGSDTTFPTTSSTPPLSQGQIAFNPWLKLNHNANPSTILTNHTTTLTATFLTNSAGTAVAAGNLSALVGVPVTFNNAVTGSLSGAQSTIQAAGTATATFTAGPTGGNGSADATVDNATVTAPILVEQLPTITSANNTTFTVGNNGSFTVTKIGFPVPNLSLSGTLPGTVSFNSGSGVLSGTHGAGTGGTYPLVITATNSVGTNTQSFTLTVDQPPAITSANNATFTVGHAGSFTVTASGYPAPTLSETGALPGGVGFTNASGILAGSPTLGSGGTYPITFTAHNGVGADATQSFTLTVNQAPSLTCPGTINTNASGGVCLLPSVPFAATASGFPAPVVSYKLGATTSTSPATFALGTSVVSVTATNVAGTNTCSFSVIVSAGAGPQLRIVRSGTNDIVSWPTNFPCYTLEFASALASNLWNTYSGPFSTNNGTVFATNGVTGTNRFFRLTH